MESVPVTRRLAAIVIADVVGYTRLMERDDTGTFARLRTIRDEVVEPAIVSHDGRIVKTAGDGLLAEFPSALAALRAAEQIQREMATRNTGVAPEDRIDYRIGVNLGDIMVDGGDIVGDGVNVASRLESLAEPGGICVSGSVREQGHGQLPVTFVDFGEQQVKNIERPIRVFRVVAARTGAAFVGAARSQTRRRALLAGGVVIVAIVGWLGAWLLPKGLHQVTPEESGPPALSIAILPFAAPSGTLEDRQFAAGLTQDLTTGLGAWRWAAVAAHALVAGVQPKTADVRVLGRELNVRYILEGEVRRNESEYVVTAQLIEAASGRQVWSDRLRYESLVPAPGKAVPYIQLTRRLRSALARAEMHRVVEQSSSATAMDLVLRANAINYSADGRTGISPNARALVADALNLVPDFVPALVSLAYWYGIDLEDNEAPDRAAEKKELDRLSSRAIALAPSDSEAWSARAEALQYLGRWEEATTAAERVVSLDPSDMWGPLSQAWILIQTGKPSEAFAPIDRARAIDPLEPTAPDHFACKAHLFLGRYGEAVAACERAAAERNGWLNHVYLCAAYAMNGDNAKAMASRDALLKVQPHFTINRYREMYAASPPAFFELVDRHLAPGLRKAGIPEK